MKSIYQFGYQIDDNYMNWAETIQLIFKKPFKIDNPVIKYPNKEKNWNESVKPLLLSFSNLIFHGHEVEKIQPSFNRYQSYVYLSIIYKDNIVDDYIYINKIRNILKSTLPGFVDNFEIPFKEPDDEIDSNKYNEVLTFQNPVSVLQSFYDSSYTLTNIISGQLFHKIDYNNQNKSQYIREFKQVYITDNTNNDLILKHFHSIMVLFHRSHSYYNELKELDAPRTILYRMSSTFNSVWPKERMKLFMLNRITHAHLYNKTFFGVLEITAQMDTVLSQIIVYNQKLKDKYDKQFERVLYNFEINTSNYSTLYEVLLQYLKSPFEFRSNSVDNIKSLYEPTDAQIDRMRSDNDSRVNFAIQSIMSILTIVFFLWGLMTFWYQTTINYQTSIIDKSIFNNQYLPATFIIMATITGITSLLVAFLITKRHNYSMCKSVKNVIVTNNIDKNITNKLLHKLHSSKSKYNKLLIITQLFNIITAYIIINIENPVNIKDRINELNDIIYSVEHIKKA